MWFLPNAEQLEGALFDGLPGAGWQLLWSRDVQNAHKYNPPGLAVSASGRSEAEGSRALQSARI